ncbi:hypothetical protein CK203_010717 [Vitis vinifera]|uniref:Uncharacterized protein n=1 Tax=Vitis vinifera TaxID=29760 RepID=A0A438JTM6_VITVI|nr:hypothetical protein CK203_010717 [Vitis vinifera]
MASSKQSTAVALVLYFLIISLGGKEAEALNCVFLGPCQTNQKCVPCQTNEECVPACSANGYSTGMCTTEPPTGNNYCCCFY